MFVDESEEASSPVVLGGDTVHAIEEDEQGVVGPSRFGLEAGGEGLVS